jgi:CheY-like chemotaxis protein
MSEQKPKVLVVEDDEVNLLIAEHVLKREGFSVTAVYNGEEAIEKVRLEAFDLIFMDIEMPIMDGLEATPVIRLLENGKRVPIIALTAHSMPEKIRQCIGAGMNDFIIKPIDPQKLRVVVNKYL